VIRKRKEQAEYYYRHLKQTQIRFLVQENYQQHPLIGFPIWVEDARQFSAYLQAHGIRGQAFIDSWWFINEAEAEHYQSSKDLMEHHFLLPFHSQYTEKNLAYIVGIVNQYLMLNP
jgi:dTDP-4-amino-4,6-dideoxygalactose transaminase